MLITSGREQARCKWRLRLSSTAALVLRGVFSVCNLYSHHKGAPKAMRDFARAIRDKATFRRLYAAPIVRIAQDGHHELTMALLGMPSPQFALKGRNSDPGVTNICNVASPLWRRWLGVDGGRVVPFLAENEPPGQTAQRSRRCGSRSTKAARTPFSLESCRAGRRPARSRKAKRPTHKDRAISA